MARSSAQRLVDTIDATGGIVELDNGEYAPYADSEWIDLADAYIVACRELGRKPLFFPEGGRNNAENEK